MKKRLLLFLLIIECLAGLSQNDSTRHIQNKPLYESKSEEISKTRRLLLDHFLQGNIIGMSMDQEHLVKLDDEDYIAIYPAEFWLLSYWTGEYNLVLNTIEDLKFDSLFTQEKIRIRPQNDYLSAKLLEKSIENKDSLLQRIDHAGVSDEAKDFLKMNLKYLVADNNSENNRQEELNKLANGFLAQYPQSGYAQFTKNFIRVKYVVSKDWQSVSIHSGKILLTGNVGNYYTSPTLLGLAYEQCKRQWLYQFNLSFAFGSKTKKDMPARDNTTWPMGSKTFGGHLNLSFGKYILDNRNISVAPLGGIGIFGLDPNDTEQYKGSGITTNIAGNIGFISDIKLRPNDIGATEYSPENKEYTFLRIGYEYIASPLKNRYMNYGGGVHKIIIGIGIRNQHKKRVY